jgi:hypothetical protein
LRDATQQDYQAKERALFSKKDKLFQSKNPHKWQYKGKVDEILKRKDELFNNRAKAFKFMLSDETL